MMVEYAGSPLAIGTRVPRFSWEVPLAGRNRRQSAYQILVATSEELLVPGHADLWDSGKVESPQSVNVPYAGAELRRNQDCFWKVGLWDEAGNEVGFSRTGYFGTALFDQDDWKGQWIGMGDPDEPFSDADTFQQERVAPEVSEIEPDPRSPFMRKEFEVGKPIRRARAFVCGLGLYELRLNGKKVGEGVLATPRTDFRKRVLYSTYDITSRLTRGANTVGLILGNGWFNGQKKYWGWQMQWYGSPRAILQLEIELEDGSHERIVTDESWRGAWSPITFNCIYDGEDYDARLEQAGWDLADFDDASWRRVNVVAAPGGRLVPTTHEAEKVVETIRPVSLNEPEPGVHVFDLGRNMTGWVRLKIHGGGSGDVIKLRFAEAVDDRGTLDTSTNGKARQEDNYILKGTGEEMVEPRFTYHGFQYVEVAGYPGCPELHTIEGRFAHVAVDRTGSFECGSDLINKIHRCTLQSQRCNIQMGVPTDDTQRPERLGWGADAWATANEALYNLWMPRVYAKWIADFCDQQDDRGMVGMIAPQAGSEEDLVWSAAFVLIPWWQYVHYGDRRILEDSYASLQRYITHLEATGLRDVTTAPSDKVIQALIWRSGPEARFPTEEERGYLQISQWGDHLATAEGYVVRANLPLSMATAFFYLDVSTMARIATVLGREEDARQYLDLASKIKEAFNERFFDPGLGYYDTGIQSAQAWPLAFGLVPEDHRQRVSSYFHSNVSFRQRRLTTGYTSTKFAIQALAMAGRDDVIWKLATATSYPSWGYMLRGGRTTTTENWHGAGSLNHAALGAAIDEWFYWGLAGIRPDESAPGFERIIFKPYLPPGLQRARASLRTARGMVISDWRKEGDVAFLGVTVPANSSATVHIPAENPEQITESGVPAAEAPGVAQLRTENGETLFEVGSGAYRFTFPVPRGH
ncbi:MAG: family 78 glycoside hydrolase catalytic domain [Candidatus Brocadiae bacterium]|nr:family 78 glycoside hydrolase catalytic domain [Candidatus Brocadiia bacterium]